MTGTLSSERQEAISGLAIGHVADFYRRYPGETVTFYTRVDVEATLPGFTLRVVLPPGMVLADYQDLVGETLPRITLHEGANSLIWDVERKPGAATRYEYRVRATVTPIQQDTVLESRAVVVAETGGGSSLQETETVAVAVSAQGRYLEHLPALYREDEFMGRFLMLFESFWAPIDGQIDSLSHYFDPQMTPPEFLPWLASWINLVLDERWPVEKRRRLLGAAVGLYRKRGTRQGLEEYLEIYTGTRPQIIEHRAHNFRLGQGARLGPGIALGRGNEPHTFTVVLRLPPPAGAIPAGAEEMTPAGGGWQMRQEQVRRRIEAIIEAEKPAHAGYTLRISFQ
jgi:phage tail-like protein